jgi:hypothetical protein
MHGSIVNFSARLMTCPLIKYAGGMLCDAETKQLATKTDFAPQAPPRARPRGSVALPFATMRPSFVTTRCTTAHPLRAGNR